MPWIFLTLMLANIVYFGWKFMEGTQPQARPAEQAVVLEGDRIQLLSERKELPAPIEPEGSPSAAEDEQEPVVVAAAPQCFFVGPLGEQQVETLALKMRAKGFAARVEQRKAQAKDYWVFFPALTSRAKAEERLRELRARGIESFIVTEGRFINAISLGHFSRRELAESFRDKMMAAGVTVEFRELDVEGVERWLYLAPSSAKADLRAAVEQEIARSRELRRENAACEE